MQLPPSPATWMPSEKAFAVFLRAFLLLESEGS
jgi:hypothetical protein